MIIAEIIATGDELRTGALVDSNSAYIAGHLESLGAVVRRHTTVGDDLKQLAGLFQEVGNRANLVVVTGGLGPTSDDRSAEAAALAVGEELVFDPEAFKVTQRFYERRKRPMAATNRKQAKLPPSAHYIDNPQGTAPGFRVTIGQADFFFLPGVPAEMRRMMAETVLPLVGDLLGADRQAGLLQTLTAFGLPESVVAERTAGFEAAYPEFALGYRAKFPEIQIKIYGQGPVSHTDPGRLETATAWLSDRMDDRLVDTAETTLEAKIGQLLAAQNATLAVAESCTGGLIGHKLTNVAGSSDYFLLSAVTYSNAAKKQILGVPNKILEAWGAVHEETAAAMAAGVRRVAGATYGLATSGIAGPGGGTPDKPVGTVCIGLATPETTLGRRLHFFFDSRRAHKTIFAAAALDMLRLELIGGKPGNAGGLLVIK